MIMKKFQINWKLILFTKRITTLILGMLIVTSVVEIVFIILEETVKFDMNGYSFILKQLPFLIGTPIGYTSLIYFNIGMLSSHFRRKEYYVRATICLILMLLQLTYGYYFIKVVEDVNRKNQFVSPLLFAIYPIICWMFRFLELYVS